MRSITEILAECLEAIERGEQTPEECLARYPEHREALAPLLDVRETIVNTAPVLPRAEFRRTATARLQQRMAEKTPVTFWSRLRLYWQTEPSEWLTRRTAMAFVLVAALVVVLFGGGGTVYASGDALPGDALYPLKTTVENVRLTLAGDDRDDDLYVELAERRLHEMEDLVAEGRFEDLPQASERLEELVEEVYEYWEAASETDPVLAERLSEILAAVADLLERAPGEAYSILKDLLEELDEDLSDDSYDMDDDSDSSSDDDSDSSSDDDSDDDSDGDSDDDSDERTDDSDSDSEDDLDDDSDDSDGDSDSDSEDDLDDDSDDSDDDSDSGSDDGDSDGSGSDDGSSDGDSSDDDDSDDEHSDDDSDDEHSHDEDDEEDDKD